MRALFEIISIAILILVGWDRPFSEQTTTFFPWLGPLAVTATPTPIPLARATVFSAPRPAATPVDRSWMFGPSPLDPPKK